MASHDMGMAIAYQAIHTNRSFIISDRYLAFPAKIYMVGRRL